jgi:hypothetical protein
MKKLMLIALTWFLTASLADLYGADAPSAEPPADVTCQLVSGTGTFESKAGPAGTEILVRGAANGYQGNSTITFGAGVAPARLKFRFAGLRVLQRFSVSDGRRTFQANLGWGAGRTVAYFDRSGNTVATAARAAVTMILEPTKSGDVEVHISSTRDVELGKELKVNWLVQYLERRKGGGK